MQQQRAYHFLPAKYALEDLRYRRLKIARLHELNDPFDTWAIAQPDRNLRREIRNWNKVMASKYGLLCFSKSWRNPLLWSHYADRHHGIALGFDFANDLLENVRYKKDRPKLVAINEEAVRHLLYTKFVDWKYEQEGRIFTELQDRDPLSGHYFADFDEKIQLREIIVGPLSTVTKLEVQKALGRTQQNLAIIKARLAYNTFKVVRNKKGFLS